MDDRCDRRELLLHLGDMLQALSRVVRADSPDVPVRALVTQQESLQHFEILRMVAPTMTVTEFIAGVASAFCRWPAELLQLELDRNAIASTVKHGLFEGNPDGWKMYVAHVRKTVPWFGKALSRAQSGVRKKPAGALPGEAGDATEPSAEPTPHTGRATPKVKTRWPWPRRVFTF